MRTFLAVAVVAVLWHAHGAAQTSVFGVTGLGYPSSPWSARARATGGSLGPLDQQSPVNPAVTAGFRSLSVSVMAGTQFRSYEAGGVTVNGLRTTRFPMAMLGGPLGTSRIAFSLSFATYLDRSFDLLTTDTLMLRGDTVPVTDRLQSDGGVIDLRGAVGWLLSNRVWVGAGLHLLSGSSRRRESRDYQRDRYSDLVRQEDLAFRGVAGSAGIVVNPASWFRAGASVRLSGDLTTSVDETEIGSTPLPHEITMGMLVVPSPSFRLGGSATLRNWSRAGDGLGGAEVRVFDTWEIAGGLEVGGGSIPVRAGFRYTQLPFSPTAERASEVAVAAGSGFVFARGRAGMNLTLERVLRDGGGASERAWQLQAELSVRP